MPRSIALLLAFVLAAIPTVAAVKKPKSTSPGRMSTPADVIKRLETSKIKYVLHSVDALSDVTPADFASKLWPTLGGAAPHPYVRRKSDGGVTLISYPVSAEAEAALHEADALFVKGDLDEAETAYLGVTKRFPDWYLAHIYLGDVYFKRGDNLKAIGAYREGIRLNPYDYAGYLFEGHALVKLGRTDDALDAWVNALALRPHQDTTLKLAGAFAASLGIEVHADRFEPRAFVRREGDDVAIYVPGAAHWIAWAACKALWLAEPGYPEERGSTGHGTWATTEDRECLAHLLVVYDDQRRQGDKAVEPALEWLRGLTHDGLLDEFVLYEFGSRVTPDVMLLVNGDDLDIKAYIRKYVVPKAAVATEVPSR